MLREDPPCRPAPHGRASMDRLRNLERARLPLEPGRQLPARPAVGSPSRPALGQVALRLQQPLLRRTVNPTQAAPPTTQLSFGRFTVVTGQSISRAGKRTST